MFLQVLVCSFGELKDFSVKQEDLCSSVSAEDYGILSNIDPALCISEPQHHETDALEENETVSVQQQNGTMDLFV